MHYTLILKRQIIAIYCLDFCPRQANIVAVDFRTVFIIFSHRIDLRNVLNERKKIVIWLILIKLSGIFPYLLNRLLYLLLHMPSSSWILDACWLTMLVRLATDASKYDITKIECHAPFIFSKIGQNIYNSIIIYAENHQFFSYVDFGLWWLLLV